MMPIGLLPKTLLTLLALFGVTILVVAGFLAWSIDQTLTAEFQGDGKDLAEKCLRFASLRSEDRARMGDESRRKAEREFDERLVVRKYLDCLRELEGTKP